MSKEKLLEIFNEANNFFYSNQSNKNQKSKHWKRFDKKKFTFDNLINFRGDGNLSEGLDDQNNNFAFKTYSEISKKFRKHTY